MRIVWQTVRKITKEILGVKVLIGPFLIDRWQDTTGFIWLSVYFFRNECHVVNGTFNINHRGFKMKSKQSLISYQWHRDFFSNPFTFDEQDLNLWLFAAMKAQIIQNISKKLVMRMCSQLPAGIFSQWWCVICLFIHELHSVRDITIFVKKTTRFWLAENECIFYVTRVHSCNFSEFWKHFFSPRHVKKRTVFCLPQSTVQLSRNTQNHIS